MNIAIISEKSYIGKIDRTSHNIRTDVAWSIAIKTDNFPFFYKTDIIYDIVICIFPKNGIETILGRDVISYLRSISKKILFMQEGANDYWQDYNLAIQIEYINVINQFDGILCHNESDVRYYKGLYDTPAFTLQSLMIEDNILLTRPIERSGVMIGGNMCSWYSGMDSLLVANNISTNITAPSMGRKTPDEDRFDSVKYLPYMEFNQWIYELNKVKYGVHMMRTFAAGTFALNCSYLGIPCIGYDYLDTQRILHPETSVELCDIQSAKELAIRLRDDDDFYNECSTTTKELYNKYYKESVFLEKFNNVIKELG